MVENLADTAVALASANVRLVARKIISKLCYVSENVIQYFFSNLQYTALYVCLHVESLDIRTNVCLSDYKSGAARIVGRHYNSIEVLINVVF